MIRLTCTAAMVLLSTTAHTQYNALGIGFRPCSWLNNITDNWHVPAGELGSEDILMAWLGGYVTGINMTLLELNTNGTPPLSVRAYTNGKGDVDVTNSNSVTALAGVVHEKCRRFPNELISNIAANAISFFKK